MVRLTLVVLLGVLAGCSARYAATSAPMTGAWARQSVGWGPRQQGMLDLTSLTLDTGATVMYGAGDEASPLYAVEFGAERSFWRVEEFEPPSPVDLGRAQTLIDELHTASLRIVSGEITRGLADPGSRGGRGANPDHRRRAHARADEIERELRELLARENLIVLRWNTGDADEIGYAIISGLRRVRLVLGRDYASEPAFPSIDERNRLGWSRDTGVVTAALQAREIVYLSRRDVGASVGDLIAGAADELERSLGDEGVIGVSAAIAQERQRHSALVSRGRLSAPRRYAVQMNWSRFLTGELPPAFSADSMADEGRWITFAVATTQLGALRRAGRTDEAHAPPAYSRP